MQDRIHFVKGIDHKIPYVQNLSNGVDLPHEKEYVLINVKSRKCFVGYFLEDALGINIYSYGGKWEGMAYNIDNVKWVRIDIPEAFI